ncbi:MAG: EF-hand domain-containing protein [Phyllobacteriaceae bacterium]|nr:EF-hand domain-containing protein [Phyllobacteriaceae bacterium]
MNTRMKSLLTAAMIAGFAATVAMAQTNFRDHFMTNWDENADGKVTLEETVARREAMFAAFDANANDVLDADELKMLDEMRANEQADMAAQGVQPGMGGGMGQGMGHGQGMGKGMMHGQGKGRGFGRGQIGQAGFGERKGMDTNGDGQINKTEFVGMSEGWFARFDRNADGGIDANDF